MVDELPRKSEVMRKKRSFEMNSHPRFDFKEWIRQEFPDLKKYIESKENYKALEERFDEVHEAAITILELTLRTSDEKIVRYYSDDLENLSAAYQAKDFKTYTKHLATLIDAIEGE